MIKSEFENKYKGVLSLDKKKWNMPSRYGVVGFKSSFLPFYIQISMKGEIDEDYLYYIMGGYIWEMDLGLFRESFMNQQEHTNLELEFIQKSKLKALKVPSKYLKKYELNIDEKYINKSVTTDFPIMTEEVKPIDDYFNTTEIPFIPYLKDIVIAYEDIVMPIEGHVHSLPGTLKTFEEPMTDTEVENFLYSENTQYKEETPFEKVVNNRLDHVKELMLVKALEYVRNGNRFHNFDVGSAFTGEVREKVLWGFLLKHIISIQDLVNDMNNNRDFIPSKSIISEKITDFLVYGLLLESSIEDKRNR